MVRLKTEKNIYLKNMDYVIEEWDKDETDILIFSANGNNIFMNDNIEIEKYD